MIRGGGASAAAVEKHGLRPMDLIGGRSRPYRMQAMVSGHSLRVMRTVVA